MLTSIYTGVIPCRQLITRIVPQAQPSAASESLKAGQAVKVLIDCRAHG